MKHLFTIKNACLFLLLQYYSVALLADEAIPEPLTLKYALSKATLSDSPEIMTYSAQKQIAIAEQDLALSKTGFFAEINGRLRYVDPSSIVPSSETNDSKISLDISKRLYDFGRSSADIKASNKMLDSVNALYTDTVSKRIVAILQAYLNVLLADIVYAHANEAMAVDYVTLDKLRSRYEVKQISKFKLLAVENSYRSTRRHRSQALSDQRMTRYHLSQLISPGKLSDALEKPDLNKLHHLSVSRELLDVQQLYEIAEKNNPRLISAQHKVESMRFKLTAFQAEKYPIISLNLQAADYARELGSSDKYRAGIEFKVPLYQAGQEDAKIKRAAGEMVQLKAEKLSIKQELEQQILEVWLKISDLKQSFSDPDFNLDYRDLYLERSRTLYELEVTSDLGDAMAELTQAQLLKSQMVFQLAVSWAKLDSLLGNLVDYYE